MIDSNYSPFYIKPLSWSIRYLHSHFLIKVQLFNINLLFFQSALWFLNISIILPHFTQLNAFSIFMKFAFIPLLLSVIVDITLIATLILLVILNPNCSFVAIFIQNYSQNSQMNIFLNGKLVYLPHNLKS